MGNIRYRSCSSIVSLVLTALFLLVFSLPLFSEEQPPAEPQDWWQKLSSTMQDKYGFNLTGGADYQQQAYLNKFSTKGTFYYFLNAEEKLWKDAKVILVPEGGWGKGIEQKIETFANLNDNADEPSRFYIKNLYLTQDLFDNKINLAAGKVGVSTWFDCNNAANNGDFQFFSSAFVNNRIIPFPDKGLGAYLNITPLEWFYVRYAISDANAKTTQTGFNTAFKGAYFNIGEFGLTPKIDQYQGNYRFIFWDNHIEQDKILSSGTKKDVLGWALSFDQQIPCRLTMFCRFGQTDPKIIPVQYFWSLGGQLDEPIPGRKDDICGLGLAQSIVGDDYRNSEVDYNVGRTETIYELYYAFALNRYLFLTPDFQIVDQPLANRDASVAWVASGRLFFCF